MRSAFATCGPQTLRYKDIDLYKTVMEGHADGIETHGDTTTKIEHLAPLQTDGITVNRLRVTNESRDDKGNVKKWSTETWYSPDLRELIHSGSEDIASTTLKDIQRVDPDPKLFYPPDGYSIEKSPDRPPANP